MTHLPPRYVRTPHGPLTLEFLGHDSIESYDLDAGFAGAHLDFADRWHVHRETVLRFDEQFTPWVETFSGIPRQVSEKLTAKRRAQSPNPEKITPIKERFLTYITRVCESVDAEKRAAILAEGLRLSRLIAISAAPAEKDSPIEPVFQKRAESILLQDLDTINSKVQKFLPLVPNFELVRDNNGKPIQESMARLLQKYDAARYALED